jgi:RND family efflux transporter MFP subunit
MKERNCLWVLLVIVSLLFWAGCSKKDSAGASQKGEKAMVTLSPVKTEDVQREIDVIGTLYGEEEATISAKVSGRVQRIEKDLGDRVEAGGTLARIDPVDYELQLAQKETAFQSALAKIGLDKLPGDEFDPSTVPTVVKAKAQAENAQAKLNRGKQLVEQTPPLMSEQDYADLETASRVAKGSLDVELLTVKSLLAEARSSKSEIDAAKQKVADAVIRVPTVAKSYVVGARMVSAGEYVREGDKMFKVVANNPMKYTAQVPERYMAQTVTGQKVIVSIASRPETFEGTITRISPQVDTGTRMYQIEVSVDNASGLLASGSFARGRILTRMDRGVKFVPLDAIVSFIGSTKVFAVKDGKAVEIQVETGVRDGSYMEVQGEMEGVDEVVTMGVTKISAGTPVTVKQEKVEVDPNVANDGK